MRIKINAPKTREVGINAETILKFLIGNDDVIDTKIICKQPDINLVTTDKDVYEALASVKQYDNFNFNKLKKFFENVEVKSFRDITGKEKGVVTFERVDEVRKTALRNVKENSEAKTG